MNRPNTIRLMSKFSVLEITVAFSLCHSYGTLQLTQLHLVHSRNVLGDADETKRTHVDAKRNYQYVLCGKTFLTNLFFIAVFSFAAAQFCFRGHCFLFHLSYRQTTTQLRQTLALPHFSNDAQNLHSSSSTPVNMASSKSTTILTRGIPFRIVSTKTSNSYLTRAIGRAF